MDNWSGSKVLITGGLGFIGSNIANRLISLGVEVSILDSLNPLYGGNLANIEEIKDKVELVIGDVRDEKVVEKMVVGKNFIFDLAAQVRHSDSLSMPLEDLDVNCRGRLIVLEACRKFNPQVKIIFSSSRMVYGKVQGQQVDETASTTPLSLYGIHKLTAEKYFLTYFRDFGIKSTILRISNPYGPRQQVKHGKYSLPGWFMRMLVEDKPITIFGDGLQLRDYIYIDDLVEAFLSLAKAENTNGEIFNCGYGESIYFKDMVEELIKTVGHGEIRYVPWPKEYSVVETGDSNLDISKIKKFVNWKPEVDLKTGFSKMASFYKDNKEKYFI